MSNLNDVLNQAVAIDGATCVALVDYTTGMTLGAAGDTSALNLEVAAAGNTDVVRAKMRTMDGLGITDKIEDILITLSGQYHLIRLVAGHEGLFLYLVLNKERANLAMARFKLTDLEKQLAL